MSRPNPISGFPEFLPQGRLVEARVLQLLAQHFELHGFAPIETRAVEPLSQLSRKGEIDKEIYVIRRLHAEPDAKAELGLHYDLTVPFARYVLERSGHLSFPFRRYQIQKVWRGERPQEGRYREFTQADIDVIGQNTLAAHHDAEIALVALDVFAALESEIGIPPVKLHLNNRKLAEGFYAGLEIADPAAVLQRIDKLGKIGAEAVAELLRRDLGLSDAQITACLRLATINSSDLSFVAEVKALGVSHELLDQGVAELADLMAAVSQGATGRAVVDLSIARGLDYYTGTVYETFLTGAEALGSVASGGRYDSLASDGKVSFPGVGYSIGVTRLLAPLINAGKITASRSVPSVVLVAVDDEPHRGSANEVAASLRRRGIAAEVAPKAAKFGKQITYAEKRGIPYVWFGAGYDDSVKDLASRQQTPADPANWEPAEAHRYVSFAAMS
ncbi:MAG: histidine--tRNA ligase [Arachnia propionica]|nr:MAG: histidine--tRNA ligase [Arachnia propionica]